MKIKFRLGCLLPAIGMVLSLLYFIVFLIVKSDPVSFMAEATDGSYLSSFEHRSNLIFALIAFFVNMALFTDCLLREKASRIAFLLVGNAFVLAWSIVRIVFVAQGGFLRSSASLVFYIAAAICCAAMFYFFGKKALDGDCSGIFWIFFYLAGVLFFFGSVMNYSLLDTYSHLKDIVFWGGYGSTRIVILLYFSLGILSATSDFDPKPEEKGFDAEERKID